MSDRAWDLVWALIPVTAAFGGLWFADFRQRRREKAERAEQRRSDLRSHLAEFLVDATAFIELDWVMIPMQSQMDTKDLTEYVDTDSGREAIARAIRLRTALTRCRLLVEDLELAKELDQFKLLLDAHPEETRGPIMGDSKSGDQRFEGVLEAFKFVRTLRDCMDRIERRALKILRVDAGDRVRQEASSPGT